MPINTQQDLEKMGEALVWKPRVLDSNPSFPLPSQE